MLKWAIPFASSPVCLNFNIFNFCSRILMYIEWNLALSLFRLELKQLAVFSSK